MIMRMRFGVWAVAALCSLAYCAVAACAAADGFYLPIVVAGFFVVWLVWAARWL